MAINRRRVLKIAGAGAGVSLLVVAGGARYVMTRTPDRALAPWRQASFAFSDARMNALSYAILAPNPHNRQPWIVAFEDRDRIAVYCDPERRLPETDPFDRQITVGLGCFIELFRMAAEANGYAIRIVAFPDGESHPRVDGRPVARLVIERRSEALADPLFAYALARRTSKHAYDTGRPVPAEALQALVAAAKLAVAEPAAAAAPVAAAAGSAESVAILRSLTWRAMERELRTPAKLGESVRLMRIGKAEIEASPDGIALGGPFLGILASLGMLDRSSLADPASSAFRQGLDLYRQLTGTAMAHIWLTTRGNSRAEQIAAGRAWLRVNLAAARAGIGIHPLSQALQEYPEMRDLYREAHERLAPRGGTVQMLARIGYGPEATPSPRWPVEAALRAVN